MNELIARAEIVPAAPPPLLSPAEVALTAYRAGVLDARSTHVSVTYAPTFILNAPTSAGPVAAAFARPERRRYSLAEVVFLAGRVLVVGGLMDLGVCLVTGGAGFLLGLVPVGGALMILGGAIGINHEEQGR
jgi:hypothetical protein